MSINQRLEKYLFRPLLMNQKLIMIYGYSLNQTKTIDTNFKFTNKTNYIVNLIHISESIIQGEILTENAEITDINKFFKIAILPEEGQFIEELAMITNMLEESIESLLDQSNSYLKAANATKSILHRLESQTKEDKDNEENLVIATPTGGLAHIVYNTIGEKYQLKEADVVKIGNVITDIVANHTDIDTEDEEAVKKMQAEIEYKIIEAMPIQLKAGEININMDFILSEIEDLQDDGEHDGEL